MGTLFQLTHHKILKNIQNINYSEKTPKISISATTLWVGNHMHREKLIPLRSDRMRFLDSNCAFLAVTLSFYNENMSNWFCYHLE